MELFQTCPTALPWAKVFSPTVIIRDGQGCQDSLVPQAAVVPGQHEQYPQPASPVLLDLSQAAKYGSGRGQSVAGHGSNTSREECDGCFPKDRCDTTCRQHYQNCTSGSCCRSPHDVQLYTKTFSRPETDHQTDQCCGQYFHRRAVPCPHHRTAVERSDRTTLRSPESDRKLTCSGTQSPPGPESHMFRSKDLGMSAAPWCPPRQQLMTMTESTSPDTSFTVQHGVCKHSTRTAVPELYGHHQKFPLRQFFCSNEMLRLESCDCPNSEKSYQETRHAPMIQDFMQLESSVAGSGSGSCPTQCPCVSRGNDDELSFRREERHHSDNFISYDMSCAGKNHSYCHNTAGKAEKHSSVSDKLNKYSACTKHSSLSGKNPSPAPSLSREVHNNHPSGVCAESLHAETRSHGLVYHGTWTLTKATPADTEPLFSLATTEGHFGGGFLHNNIDYITKHTSSGDQAFGEQCRCNEHGCSSDQSNPDLHPSHTHLQWRSKRHHAQTPDRMSRRYSPYLSAQEECGDDVPYDLSMKNVNNNKEHHELIDNMDTSFPAAQNKPRCCHNLRSANTKMCHSGNTEIIETPVHSPEMRLPVTPEYTKLLHHSSNRDHGSTGVWCLKKETPEPSVSDSPVSISSPQCQGYSHEHHRLTPRATHYHVWPPESEQSEPELETMKTVSPLQLANILYGCESLTDTQTKEQHSIHAPSATSPLTTELGHLCQENVLLTSSLSHSRNQALTPPSEEGGHHQTLSASLGMTQPACTQEPSSGDRTHGDSCSAASAALSLTPSDVFQTHIHPHCMAETSAVNTKMSTVGTKMSTVHAEVSTPAAASPSSRLQESSMKHDASRQQTQCSSRKRRPRLRNFKCDLCSVTCSNRGQLKGHLRTHTGERPFVCQEPGCNKTFVRNEELTRHRRIHSGERPYACSHCSKTFMRKDHLNKHQRMHGD